jgi:hypothetical protein
MQPPRAQREGAVFCLGEAAAFALLSASSLVSPCSWTILMVRARSVFAKL